MKKLIILLVLSIFLTGCGGTIAPTGERGAASDIEKTADPFAKYKYDCANEQDHSFDYEMQQALIDKCQNKCCEGIYCETCQWDGYSPCFEECDAPRSEGICYNCDGICWEKGYKAHLDNAIGTC